MESHIYVFGGEERFGLGPDGGQYGIFFPKDAAFDFAHWKTPPALDTEAFDTASATATQAEFGKAFAVANRSGTRFEVAEKRSIRLLSEAEIATLLGVEVPAQVHAVAYETTNTLTNRGSQSQRSLRAMEWESWTKSIAARWLTTLKRLHPGRRRQRRRRKKSLGRSC